MGRLFETFAGWIPAFAGKRVYDVVPVLDYLGATSHRYKAGHRACPDLALDVTQAAASKLDGLAVHLGFPLSRERRLTLRELKINRL